MLSYIEERGTVPFPRYTGERIYMREFRIGDDLPDDMRRWQPTIDAMMRGIDIDGVAYLMVDQSRVDAGTTQRRPGLHIDGYWQPNALSHGSNGGHAPVPTPPDPKPKPSNECWQDSTYEWPEGLLLASDVSASRAFVGEFNGKPNVGGDCSHIDVSGMATITLRAGVCYAGNVTVLHESLTVTSDCLRTLVRINVPNWSPELQPQ